METLPAEPMQQCAIPDVPPLRIRTHVSLSSPYGDSPAKCGTAVNALLDSTPTPTRHAMDAASSMVDTPAKPTMDENAAPLYMDASPTQAGKCSAKDSDFNLSAALNMISSRMGNDDEMEDEPQLQLDRPSARALRPQVANTIGVDPTRGKSVDVSPSKLMVSARGPRSCSRPALSPRLPPAGTTPAQVAPLNFARSESTASLPRAAATATSIGATRAPLTGRRGSVCGPPPMPAPTSYAFDVSRYLKELSRRGQEGQTLRWLPVQHQLQQLLAQEEMLREQLLLQESSGRLVVVHRRSEDHAKREEQRAIQASKARMEELKRRQLEELQNLKKTVADNTKLSETELREKLRYLVQLQPRLNVVGAVLTAMKTQAEDHLHLLGDLLEEDRNLQKAMRSDARLGGAAAKVRSGAEDKTATVGLAPLWMKHCLVASFNTAAILQRSSLRAAVQESSSTASAAIASGPTTPSVASARGMGAMTPRRTGGTMSSTAADRRVLIVRKEAGGAVVAWGHTRCGAQVVAMAEEYAANPPGAPLDLLPAGSSVRLVNAVGVIWPKEMLAELMRRAKNAPPPLADVIATSSSKLTFADVSSYEMSTRDVLAMGEEILMAA